MLNLEDFDFYYLIICSRGPGSETITLNKLDLSIFSHDVEEEDDDDDRPEFAVEFTEEAEAEFKLYGVCQVEAEWNDEGPVIAVPTGTMPLKGIYGWLQQDAGKIGDDDYVEFDYSQAYLSACFRVFLSGDIKADNNPWTSVNGWRKVDIEIPNKAQFEALMEATGETAEQLGQWECAVLKETAKRYLEATLPEHEFRGC
jgi:hypothetical protein